MKVKKELLKWGIFNQGDGIVLISGDSFEAVETKWKRVGSGSAGDVYKVLMDLVSGKMCAKIWEVNNIYCISMQGDLFPSSHMEIWKCLSAKITLSPHFMRVLIIGTIFETKNILI
jgi:hypothetical protein